jgi:uncharacterized membrane protein YhhN
MAISSVFLGIFVLISAAHIIFIALQKEMFRRISKVLIIPSLMAYYIAVLENPQTFPILALAFGWLGDILLINKRRRINFKLGLASFLLGHICYALIFINILRRGDSDAYGLDFSANAAFVFIPLAVVIGILMLMLIKPNKEMFLPVIIYLVGIEVMCFWAFQAFVCSPELLSGALIFSGSLFFIISDTLLGYFTFRKLNLAGAVMIMLFYIIAQAEIILGLVLKGN